jgi:hypothetical protein
MLFLPVEAFVAFKLDNIEKSTQLFLKLKELIEIKGRSKESFYLYDLSIDIKLGEPKFGLTFRNFYIEVRAQKRNDELVRMKYGLNVYYITLITVYLQRDKKEKAHFLLQ